MPTALVILPSTTYRAAGFVEAAASLGIDLIVASENPPPVEMGDRYITVDCSRPETAAAEIADFSAHTAIDGVVAADDSGVIVSALVASKLGLAGNDPEAAAATRDKARQRRRLAAAEVPQPRFEVLGPGDAPAHLDYPLVIKPVDRSAGQGVIRVEGPDEARRALAQVREIVGGDADLIVEEFVDGTEVALEGLVRSGTLQPLAVFDKPEASQGPVFPETILVTPSSLDAGQQRELERVASKALEAIGIRHGPVHVEMKIDQDRVQVIEVAARSIGGLCSRTLSFGLTGTTLETLILRNALGLDKPELRREKAASGVLMIPIPRSGVFERIDNLDEIRAIEGVTGVDVTVHPGTRIAPLPRGDRYLGFVFARAGTPEMVTRSLVAARDLVEVTIV